MSFFGRLGSEELKFLVSLTIVRVETTSCNDPLCVRFTRGGRAVQTPIVTGRQGTYEFNVSPLSLSCTLYRKKDKFLPKISELTVLLMKGTEKVFGRVSLDLSQYVDAQQEEKTFPAQTWPLDKCSDKRGKIVVKISTRCQGRIESRETDSQTDSSNRQDNKATTGNNRQENSAVEDDSQNLDDFIGDEAEEEQEEEEEDEHRDSEDSQPQPRRSHPRAAQQQQPSRGGQSLPSRGRVSLSAAQQRGSPRVRTSLPLPAVTRGAAHRGLPQATARPRGAVSNRPQQRGRAADDEYESGGDEADHDDEHDDDDHDVSSAAVLHAAKPVARPPLPAGKVARTVPATQEQAQSHDESNSQVDADSAANEAADDDEVIEDESPESDADEHDADELRKVKFGATETRLSTTKAQSPHHQYAQPPIRSNLKQNITASNAAALSVSAPTATTVTSSSSAPDTRALIAAELRSVKPISPSQIFNCSLPEAMTLNPRVSNLDVPYIFDVLLTAIEKNNGLTTLGIFRLTPDKKGTDALKKQLEEANYKIPPTDPLIIAAVTKQWLLCIGNKQPIIPVALHSQCLDIGRIPLDHHDSQDEESRGSDEESDNESHDHRAAVHDQVQRVVSQFHFLTKRLLLRLISFMLKVANPPYVEANRMSIHGLAVVFAPSVLTLQAEDGVAGKEMFARAKLAVNFLEQLIHHNTTLETETTTPTNASTAAAQPEAPVRVSNLPTPPPSTSGQKPTQTPATNKPPPGGVATPLVGLINPTQQQKHRQEDEEAEEQPESEEVVEESSDEDVRVQQQREAKQTGRKPQPPTAVPSVFAAPNKPRDRHDRALEMEENGDNHAEEEEAKGQKKQTEPEAKAETKQLQPPPVIQLQSSKPASVAAPSPPPTTTSTATPRITANPAAAGDSAKSLSIITSNTPTVLSTPVKASPVVSVKEQTNTTVTTTTPTTTPASTRTFQSGQRNLINVFDDDERQQKRDKQKRNGAESKQAKLKEGQKQPKQQEQSSDDDQAPQVAIKYHAEDEPSAPIIPSTVSSPPPKPQPSPPPPPPPQSVSQQDSRVRELELTVSKYEKQLQEAKESESKQRNEFEVKSKERELERLRLLKSEAAAKQELEQVKQQLEVASAAVNKKNAELVEMKKAKGTTEQKEAEMKQKDKQIADLTSQLSSMSTELKALQQKQALNAEREQQLESQALLIDQLQHELKERQEMQEKQENEIQRLSHLLDESEHRIADLTAAAAASPSASASSRASIDEEMENEPDSEFDIYEDDSEEVVELKQRIRLMKRSMRKKTEEIRRLKKGGGSSSRGTGQEQGVDNSQYQIQLRASEAKLAQQQKQVDTLTDKLRALEQQNTVQRSQLADLTTELKEKDLHITELVQQLKSSETQKTSDSSSEALTTQLTEARQQVASLQQQVNILNETVSRQNAELEDLLHSKLDAELTPKQDEDVDEDEEEDALLNESDLKKMNDKQKMRHLLSLQAAFRESTTEQKAKQQRIDQLSKELNRIKELYTAKIQNQQKRIEQLESGKAPAAPIVDTSSASASSSASAADNENRQLEARVASLRLQLSERDTQLAEYETQLKKYQTSVSLMEEEAEKMKQLQTTISQQVTAVEQREAKHEQTAGQLQQLQKQLTAINTEKATLQDKCTQLEQTIRTLQEENNNLQKEIDKAKAKVSAANPAVISSVSAHRELTALKEELEVLKLRWETAKVEHRDKMEIERKHRRSMREQIEALQQENDLLRQRHIGLDTIQQEEQKEIQQQQTHSNTHNLLHALNPATLLKRGHQDHAALLVAVQSAQKKISFLEKQVINGDEMMKTAKASWSASSQLMEEEINRLQQELSVVTELYESAKQGKPVELSNLELLRKKLLSSQRARDQLKQQLALAEDALQKKQAELDALVAEKTELLHDIDLLKEDLVKQGIALKTIADDNFELKEWMRINTKGKPAPQ